MKKELIISLFIIFICVFLIFNDSFATDVNNIILNESTGNELLDNTNTLDDNPVNPSPALEGLIINYPKVTLSLESNLTWTLVVFASPNGAELPDIVWTSSNNSVVEPIQDTTTPSAAIIKPISSGTATITAKTADGKYSVSSTVTVTDNKETINTTNEPIKAATDNKPNTQKNDPTVKTTKLPFAGLKTLTKLLFVVIIPFGLISYKYYRKNNDI